MTMSVLFWAAKAFFMLVLLQGAPIVRTDVDENSGEVVRRHDSEDTDIKSQVTKRSTEHVHNTLRTTDYSDENVTDEGRDSDYGGEGQGEDGAGQKVTDFVQVIVGHQTLLANGAEVFSKPDVQNYSAVLIDAARYDYRKPGVYVGAKNWLIKFDSSLKEAEALKIPPLVTTSHKEQNDTSESSQNFIRKLFIAEVHDEPYLIVCGSNASSPGCSARNTTDMKVEVDYFKALFPEGHTVGIAMYSWGSELVVGSVFDPLGKGQIIRTALKHGAPIIRSMADENWLLLPEFVDAFSTSEEDEYVYVVFKEIAIESGMRDVMYSRVGRICRDDLGGHNELEGRLVSFMKATISCRGYEKIVDMSYVERDRYLWATFSSSRSPGSVVCAFEISKVESVFRGPYYVKPDEGDPDQEWKESPPPYIFPGDIVAETCIGFRTVKAVKEYTLMFQPISEHCEPIFFPKSKLDKIAVTSMKISNATVFVNDEIGRIWYMKMDYCLPTLIQVWDAIPKNETASNKINDLAIFKDSLIVLTNENVMKIPMSDYPGDKKIPPPAEDATLPGSQSPYGNGTRVKCEPVIRQAKCSQPKKFPNKLGMQLALINLIMFGS